MELSSLTAVSPVDGRYGDKVSALRGIFSARHILVTSVPSRRHSSWMISYILLMAGASLYLHCAGQNHAVIKFCSCIQDTPAARECQACCLHFCLGCT